MHLCTQTVWEDIWKPTLEKSRSNATNATSDQFTQTIWEHIWNSQWGSYDSAHSTKGALLHPQWKSSVLSDIDDKKLYEVPCSTALQLYVDYSLRDRCIVFIQEVSVSSCMTYEIIDKFDKNFNTFPQVGVVWLWHVRHLSMTIIINSSENHWFFYVCMIQIS